MCRVASLCVLVCLPRLETNNVDYTNSEIIKIKTRKMFNFLFVLEKKCKRLKVHSAHTRHTSTYIFAHRLHSCSEFGKFHHFVSLPSMCQSVRGLNTTLRLAQTPN